MTQLPVSQWGFKTFLWLSLATPIAFAESVCTMEWDWGGCAAWETVSTLSGQGGAPVVNQDTIIYKNACPRKIQAAIHSMNQNGNWVVNGWFELNPGQQTQVAQTRDKNYYLYAETIEAPDVKLMWKGNDHFAPIHGAGSYGFFKRVVNLNQFGTWVQTFNCDTLTQFHAVAVAWNANGVWAARRANTVADAQAQALQGCNANVGPGQVCSIGSSIDPGGLACIGMVSGNGNLFANTSNGDAAAATNAAMTSCSAQNQNCEIVYSYCNN